MDRYKNTPAYAGSKQLPIDEYQTAGPPLLNRVQGVVGPVLLNEVQPAARPHLIYEVQPAIGLDLLLSDI